MSASHVQRYEHLRHLLQQLRAETPGVMNGFTRLHQASMEAGALTHRHKELISLAIGIATHCDGCITYHVHDAVAAGASRAEIVETIGVAVMMGGGPAVVYACDALEALDQFLRARDVPQDAP